VQVLCQEIIQLWAELGTPQAQTDTSIVQYHRDSPEQLGLHKDDIVELKAKKERLIEEKRGRERRLGQLRSTIEDLWERLGIEQHERKQFLAKNRGCGLRTINEFEDELARLNELKRQNLHLFVEEARIKLQELWDALYFSEEEMLDFTPAFSDVCSDALLSAHEAEIARLVALKDQRLPILQRIDRHRELVKERDDLAQSSQDASRLMARGQKGERRDPGKLLREEKMRKRIAKELPKIEADLRKTLESWEDEYGRPFLVLGDRYLDELYAAASKPAPPRAKTPSAGPMPIKQAPKSNPPSRAGTVRGPPPSRARQHDAQPAWRLHVVGVWRKEPLQDTIPSASQEHAPRRQLP
jgi:protein regulator of cytokinesis 1